MVLVLWCGDSCAGGVLMVVLMLWCYWSAGVAGSVLMMILMFWCANVCIC